MNVSNIEVIIVGLIYDLFIYLFIYLFIHVSTKVSKCQYRLHNKVHFQQILRCLC